MYLVDVLYGKCMPTSGNIYVFVLDISFWQVTQSASRTLIARFIDLLIIFFYIHLETCNEGWVCTYMCKKQELEVENTTFKTKLMI